MRKDVQSIINKECEKAYEAAMMEYGRTLHYDDCKRLRSCTAWVYETDNWFILRSYNTVVAVTSKGTGICYDLLRQVYGYTSTSAQHIAKFRHDYHTPEYMWGAPHWIAR